MQLRSAVTVVALSAALLGSAPAAAMADDGWPKLDSCEEVSSAYNDYAQTHIKTDVNVVPTEMVAGSDWQPATASITNVGHTDLSDVRARAFPWLNLDIEDPDLALLKYVEVEAKTPDGQWKPVHEYVQTDRPAPLKAGETRHLQLRIRVLPDIPKKVVMEFGFSGEFQDVYHNKPADKDVPCLGQAITGDKFTIKLPGAKPSATPSKPSTPRPSATATTAKPTATATASAGPAPSGSSPTPTEPVSAPSAGAGELARTGTSDSAVALGATGGALALLGAGTVLIARRRRS